MKVVDIYSQYFNGSCTYNNIDRHAAIVALEVVSDEGNIQYLVRVNFFPHNDEEDYLVTWDALAEETIYSAKGRRSKKKEQAFMEMVKPVADKLAEQLNGTIDWDNPLREARYE